MPREIGPEHVSAEWNYHPELPLKDSSVFQWPPSPGFLAAWFAQNWLTLSERMMNFSPSLIGLPNVFLIISLVIVVMLFPSATNESD